MSFAYAKSRSPPRSTSHSPLPCRRNCAPSRRRVHIDGCNLSFCSRNLPGRSQSGSFHTRQSCGLLACETSPSINSGCSCLQSRCSHTQILEKCLLLLDIGLDSVQRRYHYVLMVTISPISHNLLIQYPHYRSFPH